MDKPSTSKKSGRTSTRRRIREVPMTASSDDKTLPAFSASQSPETTDGSPHAGISMDTVGGTNQEKRKMGEKDSTSSSSLGLSSGEDSQANRGIRRRSLGLSNRPGREELNRVIEKLAADANREIQEIE